ncbi:MAG: CAP domain-containing protein [Thermoleophilaceae bacterium]|nr:CAP domain-containing protein [Thermoleophilaceae bacterium]
MPPRTHIAVLAASWLALLAAALPSSAKAGTAAQLIKRLNLERARVGLAPLKANRRLNAAARRQSRRQLKSDRFEHAPDLGVGRRFRHVGELIARQDGWRIDTAGVALGWQNSPPHRSLIESSSFRLVGVGWARGRLGGDLSTIWTVRLAAR